jgi:DNA-binding transcriptional regulator YdaS (Cro superfamily)
VYFIFKAYNVKLRLTLQRKESMDVSLIIKHFGNQRKLALRLGISRQAVGEWVKLGTIPANRAIQIEKITNGELKAVEMPIIEHRK